MSKNFKYIIDFIGNNKQFLGSVNQNEAALKKMQSGADAVVGGIKGIAAAAGLAFGLNEAVKFTGELAKMSGMVEGVESAFYKIATKADLKVLRQSVRGTVSDLELMKRAVMADNFEIPIKQLGSLFEFATKRAQDTGQSVDYLVESIILGIGRKSPLILDNLGISAVKLREKFGGLAAEEKTVGDVARAVGEIATEAMKKTGEIIDTNAIKIENLSAQWENAKERISKNPGFKEAVSNEIDELSDNIEVFFSQDLTRWEKIKAAFDFTGWGGQIQYLAEKSRMLATLESEMAVERESVGPDNKKAANTTKEYTNSIEGLSTRLKDYNDALKDIAPTDRGALMAKLAQISAIETQIAAIDKLKASMAGMAADEKAGFRDDKLSPLAARGTSAQNVGWDLYSSVDQVDPTKLVGTDQMNENLEENKKRVASWREQLVSDAQMVGDAFAQGFGMIGDSIVNGLGLAEDGLEGFVSQLASTVTELIAMFLGQSIAASIAGATTSGTATGPAAIFTTPAFIATAVSGVLGAFAAIPKFADGGIAFGPTMGMIGEYPGARSNPEVIAPLSKLKAMIGGGNQQIILQPSVELGYSGLVVKLNQVQQNTYKRT